jgi:threonine dehydratase
MSVQISVERILAAPRYIDPVFLNSAVLENTALDRSLRCRAVLKVETQNPVGSFKGRGTELFAATALSGNETVVCASAGNFGQGLARAAGRRGQACVVFAAETANTNKIQAIRGFGADVRLTGADFDAAKEAAKTYAAEHRLRYVEDGSEASIGEGAGTIALELLWAAPCDAIVVQLGNGSLLAGIGTLFRRRSPQTRIVAVVAQNAPAMKLSIEAGRPVATSRANTIADGIAVRVPIEATLGLLRQCCDEIIAVDEATILQAMRLAKRDLGLVLEPAGAAGIAGLLAQPERFEDQRVATILSGGNISHEHLAQL